MNVCLYSPQDSNERAHFGADAGQYLRAHLDSRVGTRPALTGVGPKFLRRVQACDRECGMQYLGANGKGLMLPRLALLVAAALIFAPYQSGGETSKPSKGADLAARVLAPAFDEGAIRSATQDFNQQLTSRRLTRLNTELLLVRPAWPLRVGIALSVLWLLTLEQIRALHRFRFASRLSRGPPLLQFT
jgi:hypothetical protein